MDRLKAATAAVVAAAAGQVLAEEARAALMRIEMDQRIENHARFEGTRAPHEAAIATARRRIRALDEAVERHAAHEGIETRGRRR